MFGDDEDEDEDEDGNWERGGRSRSQRHFEHVTSIGSVTTPWRAASVTSVDG